MNRRDALSRVAWIMGGTVIGAEVFLSGCARRSEVAITQSGFSPDVIALLDEVGETILPTTASSPGAKSAAIGEFMSVIVTDCYDENEQKIFHEGIAKLQELSRSKHNESFPDLDESQRHDLLIALDAEAKKYMSGKKDEEPTHYFTMIKQLTLWGYFTSEVGCTKALRYLPVPGKYEGCIPYSKGDKAWSAI